MDQDPASERSSPGALGTGSQDELPRAATAPTGDGQHPPPETLRLRFTRGRVLASVAFIVGAIALLYFVLPKLLGLRQTWDRIQHGNAWWLGLAAVLEVCSYCGYVLLFRAVFARGRSRIGWRESYQITMAGVAATRLFAAAGAGGIALTAWAVRRSGVDRRMVARLMIAFLVLLDGVYLASMVVCGLGLYFGPIPGRAPVGLTLLPAIFGLVVIGAFLGATLLPRDFEQVVSRRASGEGLFRRIARSAARAPASVASGVRTAIALLRTRDPRLLGAVVWWGFDIAVLWACFHAFGASPPKGEIVMGYFVGTLANALPLPGGIGGVEGGMIAAFTGFGLPVQVTVVSVLAYRVFAFWLPTLPGGIAYFQLRRTVRRWRGASELPATETGVGTPTYT